MIVKLCPNCKKDWIITEVQLDSHVKKNQETAACLSCNQIIFQSVTNGWFHVYPNNERQSKESEVRYPMP